MKKIPTLFMRDFEVSKGRLVTREVNPAAQWVVDGEGVATQKLDGTPVMVRDGKLFLRYELKPEKQAPPDFEPAQEVDPETGKQPGWIPVDGNNPAHKWVVEGAKKSQEAAGILPDGTYELLGPKVQKNPEGVDSYLLAQHGAIQLKDVPRTYDALIVWFRGRDIEGVVWHHPDGRMAKIKKRDFGMRRDE